MKNFEENNSQMLTDGNKMYPSLPSKGTPFTLELKE